MSTQSNSNAPTGGTVPEGFDRVALEKEKANLEADIRNLERDNDRHHTALGYAKEGLDRYERELRETSEPRSSPFYPLKASMKVGDYEEEVADLKRKISENIGRVSVCNARLKEIEKLLTTLT